MNINELRQLVEEEMSRFEFMKHLAGKYPELNARQIGEIYKAYKDGVDIDAAVKQVTGLEEQEEEEQMDQTRLGTRAMTRSAQATVSRKIKLFCKML